MKKYFVTLFLLLSLPVYTQTIPVTFLYNPSLASFSTVRLSGSFNSWTTTDANYLMKYDTSYRAYKITVNLNPATYQYKFVVDGGSWFADPNNPLTDGSSYGNSQLVVSDPMITYLWPLDTALTAFGDLKPVQALLSYSATKPVTAGSLTLTVNGSMLPLPVNAYDTTKRMLSYQLQGSDIVIGKNTVRLTVATAAGSKSKSVVLNITKKPRLTLLTEHLLYKKANIVLYGSVGNDSIASFSLQFNGSSLPVTFNADKSFTYPVTLQLNTNVVHATLTTAGGTTEVIDTFIYKPDSQPILQLASTVSGRILTATVSATSPRALGMTYSWLENATNPVQLLKGTETGTTLQITIPNTAGDYVYRVKVTDSEGNYTYAGCLVKAARDSLHLMTIDEHASWIDSLVLYEVFTPTFGQSQKGLKGILEEIDHIADLGATAVWMTPIFDGDSLHGYWSRDYYKINAAFGTANDLRQIVQKAHAKGIRIILDLVINHTWDQHPFFVNVSNLKSLSPFANYYLWNGTPGASTFSYYYNWTNLPNLNITNTEVLNYLVNMAGYWIREFDIDGYRCDVAWGIEERSTEFWKTMRKELRKIKPDFFLLAESPADNKFEGHTLDIFNQKFDAAYDWNFMGFSAGAIYTLLSGTTAVPPLSSVVAMNYPAHAYPMRFMENHDINRAASQFGIPKSKLGHTVAFTTNGIPLLYGGAEVAELTQRDKINWSDPNGVYPYFKRLVHIRKQYITNNAVATNLANTLPNTVYSYLTQSDSTLILTLANFSGSAASFTVTLSGSLTPAAHSFTDLFQNTQTSLSSDQLNTHAFSLAGYESKVYLIDGTGMNGINDHERQPPAYYLSQNYPNPFNPTTVISFQLPKAGHVLLRVYDVLGKEVARLLDEQKAAGTYQVPFSGMALPSGIYFYALECTAFKSVKKMVLVK